MSRTSFVLCAAAALACHAVACSGPGTLGPPDGAPDADAATLPGDARADDAPTDAPAPAAPVAHWVLPRTGPNAFLLPWPSDLTRTAGGHVDFRYVPNPFNNTLIQGYVTALDGRIAGFSTVGATYFRFSVPLDPTTLPVNVAASREAGSSVQIVNVDPASPERGRRHPAQWYFRRAATRYWTANTLAVAPAFGFPLRPTTRYAVVVTRAARATGNVPIPVDADLAAVLAPSGGDDAVARARAALAPAVAELESAGVARSDVLSLAVFTTQDPTTELFRAVDVARTTVPAPDVVRLERGNALPGYHIYRGTYGPNPVFQSGAAPYTADGTGDFVLDATGNPRVQRMENIEFQLTIPTSAPPAGGWPIAIYAHGTGGNAGSFINDGTAESLAAQGIAVLGFDQIFNGARVVGDGSAESQFFNFTNPLAGRTNNRQAAIDLVTAGRLVRRMRVPAATSHAMREETFNAARVMFFGHSQGGLNGPLWLAAENGAGAAVLSGAGGTLSLSMTQKTEPVNIPRLMALVLGIPTSNTEELVPLHPVITLAQTAVDVADPVNYARFIVREPRAGNPPRHIYMTQGFVDRYTPPDAIASLALAMGVQLAGPVPHPVDAYDLTGLTVGALPLRSNLASGRATGVWQQFDAPPRRDGHFVIFDVEAARNRAARFLASHVSDPMAVPTVTP